MLWRYPMEAASDAIDYVLIFAIIVLFQSLDAAQRAKVTEAELEAKLSEAKLENLRLQLQPHFLFNTLNAISTVMYEDVAKADKMLAQVSDFMRLVLDSSGVQTVPLAEEVRIERMYVDIMKTRLERNLALDVEIDESAREMMIPFMLLQPLLENSIRHGLGSTRSSLDLRIDVRRENGSAIVRVSDNGIGYAPSGSWGIGLRNTTDRLAHLYGARASFRIEASPAGGTVATVVLPLTTKELT
jgi:LytS/YehU family sensor histidine kinase